MVPLVEELLAALYPRVARVHSRRCCRWNTGHWQVQQVEVRAPPVRKSPDCSGVVEAQLFFLPFHQRQQGNEVEEPGANWRVS